MPGQVHDLKRIKVQWVFNDKYKIYFKDGFVLWTNSFSIIREQYKKEKPSLQLSLFGI